MTDPDPIAVKQALAELRDVNKEKRRTAVMKLGMLGGEEALRTLITVIGNHNEDIIVRGRAALMLGKLGDNRAVTPLIRALEAPGFQLSLNAIQSLGKLGDQRAIPPLLRMLNNNDHGRYREAAMEALGKLGYFKDDVLHVDMADVAPTSEAVSAPSEERPAAAPKQERREARYTPPAQEEPEAQPEPEA